MKKKFLLVLFTLSSVLMSFAQGVNGALDTVILEQANTMGKYFIAKDYKNFVKFTHPITMELMGGEEKLTQMVKESFGALEAEGVVFKNITFTAPTKVIIHEEELQCTLTQMIEMKVVGGTMTVFATLVAVSQDGGKSWYFADTAGNDLKTMRKLIPTLSPSLVIPEPMEPSLVNDPEIKQ